MVAKVKDAATGEDGKQLVLCSKTCTTNYGKSRQDKTVCKPKEHNLQMADRAKQNSQITTELWICLGGLQRLS